MSYPGEYQDPGLDHSYAAVSASSLSGDLFESPPSPSDDSEELQPSPFSSPGVSRAAVADLVRLVSLLNCDKNFRFSIYLIIIHNIVRKQIMQRTVERALSTMSKGLPNFNVALLNILQEECRKEADNILEEKDASSSSFNLEKVENFSYKNILE